MISRPWVAVMSQSTMKIFERDFDSGEIRYVKTIRNSLGRTRSRFLGRHDRGFVAEGGQNGARLHSMDAGVDSHAIVATSFAKRIAKILDSERTHGSYSSLTIIAEPKFLGRVRKSMNHETLKTVAREIPKDLGKATTETIADVVLKTIAMERSHATANAD